MTVMGRGGGLSMSSRLHVGLVLLTQLMMMTSVVNCVVEVDDRFTDRLPPFSDVNGQFVNNAISNIDYSDNFAFHPLFEKFEPCMLKTTDSLCLLLPWNRNYPLTNPRLGVDQGWVFQMTSAICNTSTTKITRNLS